MAQTEVKALNPIKAPSVQNRVSEEEIDEIVRVARESPGYAIGIPGGPEGEAFEKTFIEMMGCTDAVSVNSGSSALELAANLTGLGPGDEVILPAHTFVATAVPFARTGAKMIWADIDPDTRVVSADSIRSLVTDRTRAIIAVHLYGLPAEMDDIVEIARGCDIRVVEDCAQAPGAEYRGRRIGTIGDFGCFSFHAAKNITTLGEGGMLAVRDAEHGTQARRMRWMGNWVFEMKREKDWVPAGGNLVEPAPGRWPGNYCLAEALAAVGRKALGRLDAINEQRRHQAQRFMGGLSEFPELSFQHVPDHCRHVYHLMSARYDGEAFGCHRDALMTLMREKYNVQAIVQYWPLYRSELFRKFGFTEANVPETDRFFDNMISFPWWSDMSDELLDDMAERTRDALTELRG